MKSKIPCEPGPAPLMKLAQATGLCGGVLVPSVLKPPPARSFSRLGSRPAFIMRSDSRGSMPSMPMTITFLPRLRETWLPRAEPVVAHAQPGGADGAGGGRGRALQQGPAVHLRDGCISHQTTSCQGLFAFAGGLARRRRPRSAPCRPCSRGRPRRTSHSTVGADVDQARVLALRSGGCRRGCRARATGRRSGRRSRPSCWRGRRASVVRPIAVSHETR